MLSDDERIFLEVPFSQKDKAKALGARWDSAARKWYAPPGADMALFGPWVPAPSEPAAALAVAIPGAGIPSAAPARGLSLSGLLGRIGLAIQQAFPEAIWVCAEISELKQVNGSLFLTLIEHDSEGKEIAKTQAALWQGRARRVVEKFCRDTGADFAGAAADLAIRTLDGEARRALDHAAAGIDEIRRIVVREAGVALERAERDTERLTASVIGMGPERTLRRGFALAWAGGRPVPSAQAAAKLPCMEIEFHDGRVPVVPTKED